MKISILSTKKNVSEKNKKTVGQQQTMKITLNNRKQAKKKLKKLKHRLTRNKRLQTYTL